MKILWTMTALLALGLTGFGFYEIYQTTKIPFNYQLILFGIDMAMGLMGLYSTRQIFRKD